MFGFDPRSIPGCQTWLDASDSNTITYSSGSNVSSSAWVDQRTRSLAVEYSAYALHTHTFIANTLVFSVSADGKIEVGTVDDNCVGAAVDDVDDVDDVDALSG